MNSSQNASISLPADSSPKSSMSSIVTVLALGIVINYINGTLLHTFRKHQIFYLNPRYILFIHLVINDMIQLTTSISLVILTNTVYKINVSLCFLIIMFTIFTTLNTPLNLAVMAVECYIAVCLPLRHGQLCTIKRTCVLISCMWLMSVAFSLVDIFIIVATEPERLVHTTLYCSKNNLFRHPASLKKREVSYIIYLVCVWLTIFYTYLRIFLAARAAKASKSSTKDTMKARNTVMLHGFQLLLCMLTYVSHAIIKALIQWLPQHRKEIIFVCYIFIHVFPRFISPIVYGLRDKTFRLHFRKYVLCRNKTGTLSDVTKSEVLHSVTQRSRRRRL